MLISQDIQLLQFVDDLRMAGCHGHPTQNISRSMADIPGRLAPDQMWTSQIVGHVVFFIRYLLNRGKVTVTAYHTNSDRQIPFFKGIDPDLDVILCAIHPQIRLPYSDREPKRPLRMCHLGKVPCIELTGFAGVIESDSWPPSVLGVHGAVSRSAGAYGYGRASRATLHCTVLCPQVQVPHTGRGFLTTSGRQAPTRTLWHTSSTRVRDGNSKHSPGFRLAVGDVALHGSYTGERNDWEPRLTDPWPTVSEINSVAAHILREE